MKWFSVEIPLKSSLMITCKMQLFRFCLNAQFLLQFSHCCRQVLISGRHMTGRRNIITAGIGILFGTSFLQKKVYTSGSIFSYDPGMYGGVRTPVTMCHAALPDDTGFTSIRIEHIKQFHRCSIQCCVRQYIFHIIYQFQ